ncbi:MAG TPA: ROK family protein [Pyrinomonadaceae bacterium]|nr:ROK family protein [Pyrinomonadaceae bacterium]
MRKINLSNFQVATSETARDINRRILLNLVRTRQPISRADLARYSGLQRSTVSSITEQLISEQWITEGGLGHAPRGRKPRFLHLNSERAGIIGVDVRPRITTLALTDINARILTQDSLPTPEDPQSFLSALSERIENMRRSQPQIFCEGIGVGLPGRVDPKTQRLIFAPNLGWRDVDIKQARTVDIKKPLEEATGISVEVDNAANACALFETWYGKHSEGVHDLIALTVSEGIGAGIIADGELLRGSTGMAAEFGHVSLSEDGPRCRCGNYGCWEVYASNTAAVDYYTKITGSARGGQQEGSAPTFDSLLRLCELGDAKATEAVDRQAHYLGVGIAMLITSFAPSLIVVAAEVTRVWSRIEPILGRIVAEKCQQPSATRITPVDELAHPRLRGAIALILQKHFVAPSVA